MSRRYFNYIKKAASAEPIEYVETFTSTTTWTSPSDVTSVLVECWGGGGTGGWESNGTGSGGGGGAYARKLVTVTPSTEYAVTVGATSTRNKTYHSAGGIYPYNGYYSEDGNPSWFGTSGTCFAAAGKGGTTCHNFYVSPGGNSGDCIGDVVYSGGHGGCGDEGAYSNYYGGGGGGGAGSGGTGNYGGYEPVASGSGTAHSVGGAGGTPDGGAGGRGQQNIGGEEAGTAPGGGGGGSDGTPPSGARGQVKITYSSAL